MRRLLLAGVGLLAVASPATAQIPVTDTASIASRAMQHMQTLGQWASQLNAMQQQYRQLIATYGTLAHAPLAEVQQLASTLQRFRNMLPEAANELSGILDGSALGSYTGAAQGFMDRNTAYSVNGSDPIAQQLRSSAASVAGIQAMLTRAYEASTGHARAMQGIESQLAASPDAKSTADLQARLAAEQFQAQSRHTQVAALTGLQQSQARVEEMQREQLRRCQIDEAIRQLNAQGAGIATSGAGGSCNAASGAAGSYLVADAQARAAEGEAGGATDSTGGGDAFVASNYSQYLGQSVGSGQCVALVQAADPSVGLTRTWAPGESVQGNTSLAPGTIIATFDANGRYGNHTDGTSHAAIYLGQNERGMQVQDQWAGRPAGVRTIPWNAGGTRVNRAEEYRVVSRG